MTTVYLYLHCSQSCVTSSIPPGKFTNTNFPIFFIYLLSKLHVASNASADVFIFVNGRRLQIPCIRRGKTRMYITTVYNLFDIFEEFFMLFNISCKIYQVNFNHIFHLQYRYFVYNKCPQDIDEDSPPFDFLHSSESGRRSTNALTRFHVCLLTI